LAGGKSGGIEGGLRAGVVLSSLAGLPRAAEGSSLRILVEVFILDSVTAGYAQR